MRQRRNSMAVDKSESRNNARRLAEIERLEASEIEERTAIANARKESIQREFTAQQQMREAARAVVNQGAESRRTTLQGHVEAAQNRRGAEFNSNVSRRATAVTERQRDVFELQMQFAEQRRFVRDNPLETVGNESTENLAVSRTGEETFKTLKANKDTVLDRVAQQRSSKDSAIENRKDQVADQVKERTQNVRRRLASTYRSQASGDGQSLGRL